jgi:hypothetical protein
LNGKVLDRDHPENGQVVCSLEAPNGGFLIPSIANRSAKWESWSKKAPLRVDYAGMPLKHPNLAAEVI